MSGPKGRVILTNGRTVMSLTAAHSLFHRGIEIIGCDEVDWTILKFSRYSSDYFVHPALDDDPNEFLDALEEEVIARKPESDIPYVLMPIHRHTRIIAENRERFEPHAIVAAPSIEAMSRVQPKDRFAEVAQELDAEVPRTWTFESLDELRNHLKSAKFPLLIKPPDATGGRGISKASDQEEAIRQSERVYREMGQVPLLQELAEGDDYCFAGLFDRGKLIASMAYTNLHTFPVESGAGVFRETVDDAPFRDAASTLMEGLQWHGVAEIDFMWNGDPTTPAKIIEVNARFWGGLFQSVESGVDFPWLLYQMLTEGGIDEAPEPLIGKRTKMPFLWITSALSDFDWERDDIREQLTLLREDAQSGQTWEGLKRLSERLPGSLKVTKNLRELMERLQWREEVTMEPFYKDDPRAVLGLAFVLNSLITRGEVPPELLR